MTKTCDFRSPTNGDDTIHCGRQQGQRPASLCNSEACGGWEHQEPVPDWETENSKLREGLFGILPDLEAILRDAAEVRHDAMMTTDLHLVIDKVKALIGPPHNENEAGAYGAATIQHAEDERIVSEMEQVARDEFFGDPDEEERHQDELDQAATKGNHVPEGEQCQSCGVAKPTFDVEPTIPEPIKVTMHKPDGTAQLIDEVNGLEPVMVDGPPYCGTHMKPEPCPDCAKPLKDSFIKKGGVNPGPPEGATSPPPPPTKPRRGQFDDVVEDIKTVEDPRLTDSDLGLDREAIWLKRLEDADARTGRISADRLVVLGRVHELEEENEELRRVNNHLDAALTNRVEEALQGKGKS